MLFAIDVMKNHVRLLRLEVVHVLPEFFLVGFGVRRFFFPPPYYCRLGKGCIEELYSARGGDRKGTWLFLRTKFLSYV